MLVSFTAGVTNYLASAAKPGSELPVNTLDELSQTDEIKLGCVDGKRTRPDTRPPVADGWAGAELQLSATKNVLKRLYSYFSTRAHRPTNQPTDGRTKPLIELRVRN